MNITLLSSIFCVFVMLRNGIVYTYANDALWIDFFLRADSFALENDILALSSNLQKSIWLSFASFISSYLGPLLTFYIYYIFHTYFYFFIVFKIYENLSKTNSVIKYFFIGIIFSNLNFISGSLVHLEGFGMNYRYTSSLLLLLAIYVLICKKKAYLSQFFYFFSAIIHLPTSIAFLPINFAIILKKTLRQISIPLLFFIALINLLIFLFYYSKSNIDFVNFSYDLYADLLQIRQPYLFFKNWKFTEQIIFILIYMNILIMFFKIRSKNLLPLSILIFFHIFYLFFVSCFNNFPGFAVFKYGFDLKYAVIFIIIELVDKFDEKFIDKSKNFLISIGAISVFIFGNNLILFFIAFMLILLDKKKLLIKKIF